MASVVLFHSVLGLRPVELAAADKMRAAGHSVSVPDLFAGATADTVDRGMRLVEEIGWDTICERAQAALGDLPAGWDDAVTRAAASLEHGVPTTAICALSITIARDGQMQTVSLTLGEKNASNSGSASTNGAARQETPSESAPQQDPQG